MKDRNSNPYRQNNRLHDNDRYYSAEHNDEEIFRRAYEQGCREGYERGYAHAEQDHHYNANRGRYHEPQHQHAQPEHERKWHGKKSMSWSWV